MMARELTAADFLIESIYAQAVRKKRTFSDEGGVPVEDRWFDAIAEAYKQGVEDGAKKMNG